MMRQDSEFFGDLMFKKFELIYESLQSFEFVIYIDSDIVVKKNFIEQIFYDFQYKDIAFQNDKRPSKPNEINLCAGFMLIRSNKKMNNCPAEQEEPSVLTGDRAQEGLGYDSGKRFPSAKTLQHQNCR